MDLHREWEHLYNSQKNGRYNWEKKCFFHLNPIEEKNLKQRVHLLFSLEQNSVLDEAIKIARSISDKPREVLSLLKRNLMLRV